MCYYWYSGVTSKKKVNFAQFEVLIAVVMKISVFWDITPCSLVKVNRLLGGTSRILRQGRRMSEERNQHEVGSKQGNSQISAYYFQVFAVAILYTFLQVS
jgi:hypothetical protein